MKKLNLTHIQIVDTYNYNDSFFQLVPTIESHAEEKNR